MYILRQENIRTRARLCILRQENIRTRERVCILRQENIRTRGQGVYFKTREHKNKRVGCRQLGNMRT